MAVRKKARSKKDENIFYLKSVVENNGAAVKEGPKVKKFTLHDLKNITPLTTGQQILFESFFNGNHIVANGSAGTGKSFCAAYLALAELLRGDTPQTSLIIVRSAVETRSIGALPGDINEKLSPYEEPYKDIFATLLKKANAYDNMKESGMVKFMCTSFVRGLTWDNAIVIMDEVQSMTFHEINSVITRLGDNSKLIICGDIAQNDLIVKKNDQSGYDRMIKIISKMPEFDVVNFTRNDIIRSGLVKSWICASEDTPE